MLRRLLILLMVLTSLLATAPPALAQSTPSCHFILGFATLHSLDPGDIGTCTDNQVFAANGDAQQHTTNGLMAWRKADNWTAFTNGYWTWINGPNGLAKRLNTQRFSWEANPDGLPIVAGSVAAPAGPAPVVDAALTTGMVRDTDVLGAVVDWQGMATAFRTTVDDAYFAPAIPAPYNTGPVAPPGHRYLVLLTTTRVTRGTGEPIVLIAALTATDGAGDVFSADTEGTVYAQDYFRYRDDSIISLQPGQAERNTIAFLVPATGSSFRPAAAPDFAPPGSATAPPQHPSVPSVPLPVPSTAAPGQPSVPSVPAPAPSAAPPPAITAVCNDGTDSYSAHASGTCSHHGGVQTWVNHP